MKKTAVLLATLFVLTTTAFSQDLSYQQGNSDLNIGVGIGNPFWGSGLKSTMGVNPSVSYEYGFSDKISAGAVFAYSGAKFEEFDIKYTGILVGARGSYHFLTSEKFDPYVGLALGYVIVKVKDNSGESDFGLKASGMGYGAHLGARYFFSPNIGIHAEIGYASFSILNAGITLKF